MRCTWSVADCAIALWPLAHELGIEAGRLHAVSLVADESGRYVALEGVQPLATQQGKALVLAALPLPRPSVMVGDGSTDAAARGVTDGFIAYTGVARRPSVVAVADAEAGDFAALHSLLFEPRHMTTPDFGTFFLPGPTEVRRPILEAMLAPMLPHRGAVFESLFARIQAGLRPIFRTSRPVYVSSSSATGLMEAAIRCTPPGHILALVNGAFSERFAQIAKACDREVHLLVTPWGRVADLDQVEAELKTRAFAAVTVVHSETSTGALTPLPPLAELAHRYGAALLVDSVTGLAGVPVETDAWDLDFVLTGSQKALALPPGLAFGVASERFIAQASLGASRGLYFDLVEFEQYMHKNQTPNTPALSLLYATAAQCEAIAHETDRGALAASRRHGGDDARVGEHSGRHDIPALLGLRAIRPALGHGDRRVAAGAAHRRCHGEGRRETRIRHRRRLRAAQAAHVSHRAHG